MADLIDRKPLYERAVRLEAEALDYASKLIERGRVGEVTSEDWRIWSAVLAERTAFKHDVIDAPSAQPEIVRCGQCKYAEVADEEDAQDGYTCQFHRGSVWFSGSYCSWAERRTDG